MQRQENSRCSEECFQRRRKSLVSRECESHARKMAGTPCFTPSPVPGYLARFTPKGQLGAEVVRRPLDQETQAVDALPTNPYGGAAEADAKLRGPLCTNQ